MRIGRLAAFAATVTFGWAAAASAAVVLSSAPPANQQTEQGPCVIGDNSCTSNATLLNGWTVLPAGGSGSYTNIMSPNYTVGELRDFLTTDQFTIGIDINQTSVTQTLSLFGLFKTVGNVLIDAYSSAGTPVPDINNGNGFTDYYLRYFDLAGLLDSEEVYFKMSMPLKNDGREQFYLIDEFVPAPVPLPASLLLLLGGVGGFGALKVSRRKA